MFGKKKHSDEETVKRLNEVEEDTVLSIKRLEDNKDFLLNGLVEATEMNLESQMKNYRDALKKCLAQIQMENNFIFSLRLARANLDLSRIQRSFMESLYLVSKDIEFNFKKTDVKKAQNSYMKSTFLLNKQSKQIDEFISVGAYTDVDINEDIKYKEYDKQVDAMLLAKGVGTTTKKSGSATKKSLIVE